MDLPTCPACGQSVLDDEAKDCPFCGASMSGKPQAKQPTAPATAAAAPQAAAAAQDAPAETKPAPAKKQAPPADDDPFAVDKTARQAAIPLRPKPTKGRAHKVTCPMCETPGYTSTKAAGKDVRCSNPECLVPIFTAPELPKEKPPEPEKKRRPIALLAVAAIVLLGAIGGGVWYFYFLPAPGGDKIAEGTYYVPKEGGGAPTGGIDQPSPANDPASPLDRTTSSLDDPRTPQELAASSLKQMGEACLQRDNNRSKSYCRRLTATAFAHAGRIDDARQHLVELQSLRPPYYRIEPLVEIAWKQMAGADSQAAGQTLDEAVKLIDSLPSRGRSRLESAVDLAAALVAAGRVAEAQQLIDEHQSRTAEGEFAAELAAMRESEQFNADDFIASHPIYRWTAPQTLAVVMVLAAHGHSDKALKWASGRQTPEVRSEAVLLWADTVVRQSLANDQPADMAAIDAAAAELPPVGRARLHARLAARLLTAGQQSQAQALLAKAHAEMDPLAPPAEMILPGLKEMIDFRLPAAAPARMQALAAAEIGVAESHAGQTAKAVAAFQQSLQTLRGSAPTPLSIRRRINEIDDRGISAMRDRVKQALQLKTDDEARLVFNDYRRHLNEIAAATVENFEVREAVLTSAAKAGLLDFVRDEIDERNDHTNLNLREPWAATRVPWLVADRYQDQDKTGAAQQLLSMLQAANAQRAPINDVVMESRRLLQDGQFDEAAAEFEGRTAERASQDERDRWRLRLAGRLVGREKIDAAFDFVDSISDASIRDDILWFISAQATQAGQARHVWDIGQRASWSATETASIYGGLVHGLPTSVPATPTADID